MGKKVVADESGVQDHVASLLLARTPLQYGLLVGLNKGPDAYVLRVVPTPKEDKAAPLPGLASLNNSWIVEHALQVARMLPGGVEVLGLYGFAPLDDLTKHSPQLFHVLRLLSNRLKKSNPALSTEKLLLFICSQTKKYVAKSYDLAVKKEDPRTVDLSFEPVGKSLARFRASYSFSIEILISGEKKRLQEEVAAGLRSLAPGIQSSFALAEGTALDLRTPILDLPKPQKGDARVIELMSSLDLPAGEGGVTGRGVVRLSGAVTAHAYAHTTEKAALETAVSAIKSDILNTITVRFDSLCDELSRKEETADPARLFNPFSDKDESVPPLPSALQVWALPQRVTFMLNNIVVSDYLLPSETTKDAAERMSAMLGVEIRATDVECKEQMPPGADALLAKTAASSNASSSAPAPSSATRSATAAAAPSSPSSRPPLALLLALLLVVIAVMMGVLLRR